jgi:hypothetical protein
LRSVLARASATIPTLFCVELHQKYKLPVGPPQDAKEEEEDVVMVKVFNHSAPASAGL